MLLRTESKIDFAKKKLGLEFFSCVIDRVEEPLCYRTSLQGIGRLTKFTKYNFRQVHNYTAKNFTAMENLLFSFLNYYELLHS